MRFLKIIVIKIALAIFNIFIFFTTTNGQSITPMTLNNGGGFSPSMEWSICESTSIAFFNTSLLGLNTGVLQPMTNLVTSINEIGFDTFGNQVSIGPNPTYNQLNLNIRFHEMGDLTVEMLNSKSDIYLHEELGKIGGLYNKTFFIEKFPSGIYYIRIYFKNDNGLIKRGTYKIIKL